MQRRRSVCSAAPTRACACSITWWAVLPRAGNPACKSLVEVGYLMRTTAVYGNGKFGLADLVHTFDSGLFSRPFEAEMLTVYLIREFTLDLVEHIARARAPERAVRLAPRSPAPWVSATPQGSGWRRSLTAHPTLIHRWIGAREERHCPCPEPAHGSRRQTPALSCLAASERFRHVAEWRNQDARQAARIERLHTELVALANRVGGDDNPWCKEYPWRSLCRMGASKTAPRSSRSCSTASYWSSTVS